MRDDLAAATAHVVGRLFAREWKFESKNVVPNDDGTISGPDGVGNISTNVGYREAPTTGIGSATNTITSSGESVIQMSSSSQYCLALTLGSNPWVCG